MKKLKLSVAGAVAAALLSGCMSLPTTPPATASATAPSMAPAWQAALPQGSSGSQPLTDLLTWWRRFNDPALESLMAAAQSASPSLASALARVERARANRVSAQAALLPRLDAAASASQAKPAPGQPQVSSLGVSALAGWEIDLFGAAAAGSAAAQARLAGAQALWHDARITVAAETATSYTALRACEAQRAQTQADAASRAETTRLTELSARAGFTAPADAALARAGAAQARSAATRQRAACDSLIKSLVEISGLEEAALRQTLAAGTAQMLRPEPIVFAQLPAALLAQRPDLQDAARAVEAAAADQQQAQAQQLPQISLSGMLGGQSQRSAGLSQSGAVWSFGPLVVNFPLFDGGRRAANTAAARASYDEAVTLYRAQARRAVREVEDSLVTLQASAEREQDAESAARDFEASMRATTARQKGGLASLFELEVSRRDTLAAQSALIELQRERTTAWISLYRALGGGWVAGAAP